MGLVGLLSLVDPIIAQKEKPRNARSFFLDLNNHWNDHWPALSFLKQILSNRVTNFFLDVVRISVRFRILIHHRLFD